MEHCKQKAEGRTLICKNERRTASRSVITSVKDCAILIHILQALKNILIKFLLPFLDASIGYKPFIRGMEGGISAKSELRSVILPHNFLHCPPNRRTVKSEGGGFSNVLSLWHWHWPGGIKLLSEIKALWNLLQLYGACKMELFC